MNDRDRKSRFLYLIPLLGTALCVIYILAATRDVVYSDYIRLINSYLPDVWDPGKFFVADIFTRMPVNFLERIVNVELFGYSTTFEMVLGAVCLGLAGTVLTTYCRKRHIGIGWYLLIMAVFFSLNKWEMLTNGTGWCHFLAFAGFYYHYLVWDRVWQKQTLQRTPKQMTRQEADQDRRDRRLLMLLPWLITLGTAGPYCGAYSAILVLTYGICFLLDWRQKKRPDYRHLIYLVHVLVPLGLYLISSTFAVEEHAGATGRSIGQVLGDNLSLFPKFIIKSFSSAAVGSEVLLELLTRLNQGMALCYLAGLVVLAGYLLALWLQLRGRLYCTTVFPLMFILWGGLNHLLVLAARWIFENSDYGMSSRYALQYQVGILGILMTFALAARQKRKADDWLSGLERLAAVCISLVILAGNGYTTCKEIQKAPNRREYAMQVEAAALDYEEIEDDKLEALFQYHHGPEKIRQALRILEENRWNIYGGH
ncbi:MAG: hypothetical protein Q4C66_13540 [Lachnospiraceae bacterium]|nr:hypothetical protein [Lachnospiraceae bacterium]